MLGSAANVAAARVVPLLSREKASVSLLPPVLAIGIFLSLSFPLFAPFFESSNHLSERSLSFPGAEALRTTDPLLGQVSSFFFFAILECPAEVFEGLALRR